MSRQADHLDDERLSDLIDGAGSDTDRAHVAHCDSCRARWDAWKEVSRAVSTRPQASAEQREAAIQAALSGAETHGTERTGASVVDLALRRKRHRVRVISRAAAAAAAVALISGVSAALVSGGGGNTSQHASTAAPASRLPPARSGGPAASPLGLAPPAATAPLIALGSVNSAAQLVNALKATTGSATSGSAAGGGVAAGGSAAGSSSPAPASAVSPTPGETACTPPPSLDGTFDEEATLVWKGTPAVAFVFLSPNGHRAVVESDSRCKVLATVPY
ncbi:MAG TPA: hypothetical protein VFZ97_09600 [Acidimicrobiales bacterium]